MKTKFFTLFAAFTLLFGAKAMAQTDGDVNGDGVVNKVDILALLKFMKNAEETGGDVNYYWYAGQVKPVSMVGAPVANDDFICNNWFDFGTVLPDTISQRVIGGNQGEMWYAAFPTNAYYTTEDPTLIIDSKIMINDVEYTVWCAPGAQSKRFNLSFNRLQGFVMATTPKVNGVNADVNEDGIVDMTDIAAIVEIMSDANSCEVQFYWYAGQEKPISMNSNPTIDNEYACNNWFDFGTVLPSSFSQRVTGGISGQTWYAAFPTAANFIPGTSGDSRDTSVSYEGTITINGIKYDVWYAGGVTSTRFNLHFFNPSDL